MIGQSGSLRTWDDVSSDLDRLIRAGYTPIAGYVTHASRAGAFEASVVSNTRDLLVAVAASGSCPVEIFGNPYTGAIDLDWGGQDPAISVEVYEDRYELCLIYQGRIDIRYFDHTPASPVPGELLKQLPRS